jgi:hypothetical protein
MLRTRRSPTEASLKFLTSLFSSACLLFGSVTVTFDDHTDFRQFKTYSFFRPKQEESLWLNGVEEAVEAQLAAKGWVKVDSGADAMVTAFGSLHMTQSLKTVYEGYGDDWYWEQPHKEQRQELVPIGTLVVDVFNAKTKTILWRASATDVLAKRADQNVGRIKNSVREMFKKFPVK